MFRIKIIININIIVILWRGKRSLEWMTLKCHIIGWKKWRIDITHAISELSMHDRYSRMVRMLISIMCACHPPVLKKGHKQPSWWGDSVVQINISLLLYTTTWTCLLQSVSQVSTGQLSLEAHTACLQFTNILKVCLESNYYQYQYYCYSLEG